MYAFRPDWWDIGHVEGSRAYITILTIRALREYVFMSSFLKKYSHHLMDYEQLAEAMQTSLQTNLWDEQAQYLMNWNGQQKDSHYYMGSLLAPAFGLLGDMKSKQLVATATKELVDERIGVRAAVPADFHTKEAIAFFKFASDEAGQPYFYINGGVWQHNNAWYALALKNVGRVDDAVRFVKSTMTLDGIARSPNGIPAMYEYRYSNAASPDFGKIDKPSFLWAGGFYLYTLYHLFGVNEDEWNISLSGPLPSLNDSIRYTLTLGNSKEVSVRGNGNRLKSLTMDGKELSSLVLPAKSEKARSIDVTFGNSGTPYLVRINAILHGVSLTKNILTADISSFEGHGVTAEIVAPTLCKRVLFGGKRITNVTVKAEADGLRLVQIHVAGTAQQQKLNVIF